MKIALLTDGIYPYVIGGMQKHSYYLAKYLARQKVEVFLFHHNQSNYDINKLEYFTEEEKKYIHSTIIDFPNEAKGIGHYIRNSYKYSVAIYESFLQQNISVDFIYAKGFTPWKMLEEKIKGISLPPIGVNFHGYEMFQKNPSIKSFLEQKFLLRPPVLFITSNADVLFSYGGTITEIIKKIERVHDKIVEIPTGIEKKFLLTAEPMFTSPVKFLFIGRNERRKGINEIEHSIRKLLSKSIFHFSFVGPIKPSISHKNVKYHGEIRDTEEIKMIIKTADVLVCPSYSEGMPNVIMEAMASGLAIIASNVGAVSEQVSALNGVLISPGNFDNLEQAMLKFIDMPVEEIVEMKRNSIASVKTKFLWEDVVIRTIAEIKRVIKYKNM